MIDKNLLQFHPPSLKIESIISRTELLDRIKEDYNRGNYETSVTKAFKYLEENYILSNFETKSTFSVKENIYKDVYHDKSSAELKTLHIKMLGAMYWIKNLTESQNESSEATARVLAYVDLQLKLLDKQKN